MDRPEISIVMPVFNAQDYVAAAIESMLRQSFRNFEFVIVDDGSTDGTLSLIRKYAEQDSRIQYMTRPNTGIVGALNDGVIASKGRLIARMDADDLCSPDRLQLQREAMNQDAGLVVVGSCAEAICPRGTPLGPADVPLQHHEIETAHLAGCSSIYHSAAMIRTDALRQVGGYREGYCPAEDFDLWLRLGEVGRLANLPQRLLVWRRTLTGITSCQTARIEDAVNRCLSEAWTRRRLCAPAPRMVIPPVPEECQLTTWGWGALRTSGRLTALRFATRSLITNPLHGPAWRLVVCVFRGY